MTDPKGARQPLAEVLVLAPPPAEPVTAERELRFRQVYEECFGYVWTILRRLGVFERDLEDAVHDVFVVFHRRRADFDTSRPARPWLAGIAARVASDFRRRAVNRREHVEADVEAPDRGRGQQAELEAREARRVVHAALGALEMDRRAVFVLCELEGYTVPEIAAVLEVPLNTAYSRLRLARRDFAAAVRALSGGEGAA